MRKLHRRISKARQNTYKLNDNFDLLQNTLLNKLDEYRLIYSNDTLVYAISKELCPGTTTVSLESFL